MPVQISDLRVAIIRLARLAEFPDRDPIVAYEKAFASAQQGQGIWQPPWPDDPAIRKYFWERYVETGANLAALSAEKAWKYLVPLRTRLATFDKGYVDGLRFPHAAAVMIWLTLKGAPLDLAPLVNQAVAAYQDDTYNVRWDIDGTTDTLTLDRLTSAALDQFRGAALGGLPVPDQILDPFTIATVVSGTWADFVPEQPVEAGGEIHKALEGLCTWVPHWQGRKPRALQPPYCLEMRAGELESHVFYGLERGRAGWFPGTFTIAGKVQRSLGCYHRNLAYATLQTESLIEFLRLYRRLDDAHAGLPPSLRTAAINAVNTLRRLCFGSKRSAYRSWSVRLQIDEARAFLDEESQRLTGKIFEYAPPPAGTP